MEPVLKPGQTFVKWKVEKLLGAGGMGEVYLARDEWLCRDVALKVLPVRVSDDPMYVDRIRREAAAGTTVRHPNLVEVIDAGMAEGKAYLVMEYLPDAKTLRTVTSRGRVVLERALPILVQICDGVRALHMARILHRDLKPENIMILEGRQVKVIDFGLAKIRKASIRTTVQPAGGGVLGTAQYMSPELIYGGESSEASDVYTLGLIAHEILTGGHDFQDADGSLAWTRPRGEEQTVSLRLTRDTGASAPPVDSGGGAPTAAWALLIGGTTLAVGGGVMLGVGLGAQSSGGDDVAAIVDEGGSCEPARRGFEARCDDASSTQATGNVLAGAGAASLGVGVAAAVGGNVGYGGGGAGASIALASVDATIALSSTILCTSDGGAGGDGAAGQPGQEGGDGAIPGGPGACSGGNGGDGGQGGSGGGGRGGHSLGIAYTGAAPTIDASVTFDVADAGPGGAGGVGIDAGNVGGEGAVVEAAEMLELPGV